MEIEVEGDQIELYLLNTNLAVWTRLTASEDHRALQVFLPLFTCCLVTATNFNVLCSDCMLSEAEHDNEVEEKRFVISKGFSR